MGAVSLRLRELQQAAGGAAAGVRQSRGGMDEFGRGARAARDETGGLAGGLGLLRGAMGALAAVGAAVSVTELGTEAIGARRAVEQLDTRIKGLVGSGAALAETQDFLGRTSRDLRVDQLALTDSYAQLLNLKKADLVTTAEARGLLVGFVNVQKETGASTEQLNQTMYGLSQALGSGVVRAEEFNQVTEPLPGLMQALDRASGQMSGGFRRLVVEGKVTSAMFKDTLVKALDDYAGAAERSVNTIVAVETRWANSRRDLLDVLGQKLAPTYQAGLDAASDIADQITAGQKRNQEIEDARAYTTAVKELTAAYVKLHQAQAALDAFQALPARAANAAKEGELLRARNAAEATVNELIHLTNAVERAKAANDGWAEMWGVAGGGIAAAGRVTADQIAAFTDAAKAAGYVYEKNKLVAAGDAELATRTQAVNSLLALTPAALRAVGLDAGQLALVLAQLQHELDPVTAAIAALNVEAALLAVPAGFDRRRVKALQDASTPGREMDFDEAIRLDDALAGTGLHQQGRWLRPPGWRVGRRGAVRGDWPGGGRHHRPGHRPVAARPAGRGRRHRRQPDGADRHRHRPGRAVACRQGALPRGGGPAGALLGRLADPRPI